MMMGLCSLLGRLGRAAISTGCVCGVVLVSTTAARAWTVHDIYRFKGSPDGSNPYGGLVTDGQGRLYGVTRAGGAFNGQGTVFRLDPPARGGGLWSEEILHSFDGTDGAEPSGTLVVGSDGSIYGTTLAGGPPGSAGTVFKLTDAPAWPITILHSFQHSDRVGGEPNSLTLGPDGLLYGTTQVFGTSPGQEGMAFSVSPLGDQVEFKVLHEFGMGTDGIGPYGLTLVPAGYFGGFVGATSEGGAYGAPLDGYGTVFTQEILSGGGGPETVLYDFQGPPNFWNPVSSPIVGKGALRKGLYGLAGLGGTFNQGGLYSLMRNDAGGTTEAVLYSFGSQPGDAIPGGDNPLRQINTAGVLIGSASAGGRFGYGALFELMPPSQAGAGWTDQVEVSFNLNDPISGANPIGGLVRIGGQYYGALQYGALGVAVPFHGSGYGAIYVAAP